jgi:N utilization substance protein B
LGKRRKSREIAVQMLYQIEIMEQAPESGVRLFLDNFPVKENVVEYAVELVYGVCNHLKDIDSSMEKFSQHWKIERMTSIDRNILRLATYEIMYKEDIPKKVCINEALEISKKFSSADSSSFINGILDAIVKSKDKNLKRVNES